MVVRVAELSEQNARLQARIAALENAVSGQHDAVQHDVVHRDVTTK
jgi:hypothetical protein